MAISRLRARQRRAVKTRQHIKRLNVHRLCVHKSLQHIYVQLISPENANVIASASTLDKEVRQAGGIRANIESAKVVGAIIAKRILKAKVKKIAFDRSGFKYHGVVKALADSAREGGIEF